MPKRCDKTAKHAAHGQCPGRHECVKCHVVSWGDQLVVIRELRKYNGKRRHAGCRL
jgi:hypothetical protein